jgi:hypothetical protein
MGAAAAAAGMLKALAIIVPMKSAGRMLPKDE